MNESIRTLAGFQLRSWIRSRGPLLWALFLGVWGWFNWETFRGEVDVPWWAGWSALAAWLGFLAGYDTYARMREEGTLRLVLLHPSPRGALVAGSWAGSVLIVVGALLLFLGFVGLWRPIPLDLGTAGHVVLVLLTAAAFAAYAQLASLVMPRDTSAVLGLLVVILGSTPHDYWIPAAAPGWMEPVARAVFFVLPTSNRLAEALSGGAAWETSALLIGQVATPLLVIGLLLGRPALTRRPGS